MPVQEPSFMDTIEEVKKAEKEAKKARGDARAEADNIILKGKEEAGELRVKSEHEVTDLKNEIIAKGKKETDKEADKIIAKAKEQAKKVGAKKADSKLLKSVFEELISM